MLLISPTEPPAIKRLGKTSSLPEKYGVDILWFGKGRKFGVQRKEFPGDFTSSLHDGRLHREVHQMGQLDGAGVIVLEGFGQWTDEGELIARSRLTLEQLHGLIFTAYLDYNIPMIRVKDVDETETITTSMVRWSRKIKHKAFEGRPGPKSKWGTPDSEDWLRHLVMGFDGVGPERAQAIIDHLGGVPFRWNVEDMKDLLAIPGIGKKGAKKLWEALDG